MCAAQVTTTEGSSSKPPSTKLGQWLATGICGNDISSSCLYVSALALMWAGRGIPGRYPGHVCQ